MDWWLIVMDSPIFKRRKLVGDKIQESSPSCQRKWEELDINILRKIFSHSATNMCNSLTEEILFIDPFPIYDTIITLPLVCHSWKLACWDALFWGKNLLDLRPAMAAQFYEPNPFLLYFGGSIFPPNVIPPINANLMKFLKSILMEGKDAFGFSLEQWRLSIKIIFVPKGLKISDQHLSFLAERTPNVETLVLLDSSSMTMRGLTKAISSWKKIKHVTMRFGQWSFEADKSGSGSGSVSDLQNKFGLWLEKEFPFMEPDSYLGNGEDLFLH